MQVLTGPSSDFTPSVVALGVFDGVHRGHQVVIRRAVERARALGVPAVVVTFEPHPLRILAPDRAPGLLQDLDQRMVDTIDNLRELARSCAESKQAYELARARADLAIRRNPGSYDLPKITEQAVDSMVTELTADLHLQHLVDSKMYDAERIIAELEQSRLTNIQTQLRNIQAQGG